MSESKSYIIGTVFPVGLTVQHIRSQKCYPRFLEVLRMMAKYSGSSTNNDTLRRESDHSFGISRIVGYGKLWHFDYLIKYHGTLTPHQFLKKYKQEIEYLELKEKHGQSLR